MTRRVRYGHCPACERYIGQPVCCPFCDVALPRTFWLPRLLLPAVVLILLALVFLPGRQPEPLGLSIKEVTVRHLGAWVRVHGAVDRKPALEREAMASVSLSFAIKDGTERVELRMLPAVTTELLQQGVLPRKGEPVQVLGHLEIGKGGDLVIRGSQIGAGPHD